MNVPFSTRLPRRLGLNRLTTVHAQLEEAGVSVLDLTVSNPTTVGLRYPAELGRALGAVDPVPYRPAPFGLGSARDAVARYLRQLGLPVEGHQVMLTASTSETYSMLFKLLCDPGQEVAVPRPSYPLLDYLARLESVRTRPYPLEFYGRWAIDVSELVRCLTPRTRAVVLVNPHNPTGSFVSADEFLQVAAVCRERRLAMIVDEVFGVFPMADTTRGPSVLDTRGGALTFVLGGLSKAVGLPGLKLGWCVISGSEEQTRSAITRLEVIADTYLSVATPVQVAAGEILHRGRPVAEQIIARVRANHRILTRIVSTHPAATLLPVEGGWYAVVQVPATSSEEALVLDVLERDHVLVHPGYFFDFPREAFMVLSLLPETTLFETGARRVLARTASDRSPGS